MNRCRKNDSIVLLSSGQEYKYMPKRRFTLPRAPIFKEYPGNILLIARLCLLLTYPMMSRYKRNYGSSVRNGQGM